MGARPLESAADALAALSETAVEKSSPAPKPAQPVVQTQPSWVAAAARPPATIPPQAEQAGAIAFVPAGPAASAASTPKATVTIAPVTMPKLPANPISAPEPVASTPAIKRPPPLTAKSLALAAVTAIAMAEAVVIGAQWYFKPVAVVEAKQAPVAASEPPAALVRPEPVFETAPKSPAAMAGADMTSVDVNAARRRESAAASAPASVPAPSAPVPSAAAAASVPPAPAVASPGASAAKATAPAAGGSQRVGGMTFVSTLELQVLEGGKRIGVSGGPIAATEGTHTVDLVNDALGFRVQQTVIIKAGELTSRTIPVPNGRISINAVPWAEIWIDGSPAGQTPLANLSIPIGEHQITFRHPQFGEQRQTATVKSDGVARLSARMQQ
jgi:hypothetical protein